MHMPVHMKIHAPRHMSVHTSAHMPMHMSKTKARGDDTQVSALVSLHMSVHMPMHMSMRTSVHMSMHLSKTKARGDDTQMPALVSLTHVEPHASTRACIGEAFTCIRMPVHMSILSRIHASIPREARRSCS